MKIGVKEMLLILHNLPPKYQVAFKIIQDALEAAEKEGRVEEVWEDFRNGWNSAKENDPLNITMPEMPTWEELYGKGSVKH
jgi:hypothetical protein